jgi:hypothetical protein
MAAMRHVLVIASRTATADELRAALLARAERGPIELTLLMPAPDGAVGEAGTKLRDAVEQLRAAGLDIVGQLGAADPYAALTEVWEPGEYDEIVLGTLPPDRSHWLALELPERIQELTGLTIEHVVASPAA